MNKLNELVEHLKRIATERQAKLRAELGEEAYRAEMRKKSLIAAAKRRKAKKKSK